jgi:hypothetical protein
MCRTVALSRADMPTPIASIVATETDTLTRCHRWFFTRTPKLRSERAPAPRSRPTDRRRRYTTVDCIAFRDAKGGRIEKSYLPIWVRATLGIVTNRLNCGRGFVPKVPGWGHLSRDMIDPVMGKVLFRRPLRAAECDTVPAPEDRQHRPRWMSPL